MPNRLQQESSPYLLQHANNPVDWYAWSDEALQRAADEQKPIFLSVGYSACHWCHVMEHESFEDEEIARVLNDHFVCIKVDREERPDIDQIYMQAVQILTGRGGWPMSVFLTPDRQPFFGGTYWPPRQRMGMPGFDHVLRAVIDAWQNRKEQAIEQAQKLTDHLASSGFATDEAFELSESVLDHAARQLASAYDATFGGFGDAPKFPHSMDLQLLLRIAERRNNSEYASMVKMSLDRMAHGGIYDHLGGGFARYSTDAKWLVPHFEKMLYDNALLASAYLDSYLATGDAWHARVVRETLDYVCRDMTDADGGFYCAEDADSEGVEGKFYVWSQEEIESALGDAATEFCRVYGVSEGGNFEGRNILYLPQPLEVVAEEQSESLEVLAGRLDASRAQLQKIRDQRVHPSKDDKVIVSWNGLMIDSFARASRGLDEDRYRKAAIDAAGFIESELWDGRRLLHSWRQGIASTGQAFLDDYASLANGLVSLYEATFDAHWLEWAFELIEVVTERFADPDGGAFYYTADDGEPLITRPKDLQDSSIPSGNAMAATAMLRLAHLGHRDDLREGAMQILQASTGLLKQAPAAAGQMLIGLDFALGPVLELAVIGESDDGTFQSMLQEINRGFLPRAIIASKTPSDTDQELQQDRLSPLFLDRTAIDDGPTAYLCVGQTCEAPIQDPMVLAKQLARVSPPSA